LEISRTPSRSSPRTNPWAFEPESRLCLMIFVATWEQVIVQWFNSAAKFIQTHQTVDLHSCYWNFRLCVDPLIPRRWQGFLRGCHWSWCRLDCRQRSRNSGSHGGHSVDGMSRDAREKIVRTWGLEMEKTSHVLSATVQPGSATARGFRRQCSFPLSYHHHPRPNLYHRIQPLNLPVGPEASKGSKRTLTADKPKGRRCCDSDTTLPPSSFRFLKPWPCRAQPK
jgi:hypothetical protein